MKATFLALLALVLIAGGAVSHNEHHGHHQPPPLLEMLPPIGPAGSVVAIGAMAQYLLNRTINRVFETPPATSIQIDHDGHHHEGEGGGEGNGTAHGHDHNHDGHGGGDDHGGGDAGGENPLEEDDPEEFVPIVDAADDTFTNRSVVVNPKGTQGKRYIVVEVYMQRGEPKDIRFKERAGEKTKRLQEIVTSELESKTVEDLQKPITKEFIRRTLQKKFNGVLATKEFSTPVGKIVFSKWIMQ